jgi:uncharacterized protein involved in exopolysaccharide biosynthesis
MTTPRARATEPLAGPFSSEAGRQEPTRPPEPPERDEITVVWILSVLLRYRVMIIALALAVGFFTGLRSVSSPHFYTTEAQFLPKGTTAQGQLGVIAQQFGLSVGSTGQSAQLYLDLLKSRPLLWQIAKRQYTLQTDSGTRRGDLLQLYHVRGKNPLIRKAAVIDAVTGQIKATSSAKTGVITVTVSAGTPGLAVQIAQAVLDEVNLFNLNRRQGEAGAQRAFIEKRVAEAQGDLRQAEENLQSFLTENRDYRSPSLALEFDRLNRVVTMRQQLYTSLAQAYETAKIEEVRDLPVITIMESPEMPIEPTAHGGSRKTLIGLLIGGLLGVLLAFARDGMAVNRQRRTDDFLEFEALKREALDDLTHPWRPVRRVLRPRSRS